MPQLIYFISSLPLIATSIIYGFIHLFLPTTVDVLTSTVTMTLSLMYFLVLAIVSTTRSMRGTYADRIVMVLSTGAVLLFNLASTVYNPWNWVWVALWTALLVLGILSLRSFYTIVVMTPEEKVSLDSLTRRI